MVLSLLLTKRCWHTALPADGSGCVCGHRAEGTGLGEPWRKARRGRAWPRRCGWRALGGHSTHDVRRSGRSRGRRRHTDPRRRAEGAGGGGPGPARASVLLLRAPGPPSSLGGREQTLCSKRHLKCSGSPSVAHGEGLPVSREPAGQGERCGRSPVTPLASQGQVSPCRGAPASRPRWPHVLRLWDGPPPRALTVLEKKF